MNRHSEEIVAELLAISRGRSPHEVFRDWVHMYAIAISNICTFDPAREEEYMAITRKYTNDELNVMCKMSGMLAESLEDDMHDYLGEVYMGCNLGNSRTGQFFTPFHLSELTAATVAKQLEDGEKIKMYEPSCGGGGMIIGLAKYLDSNGLNYQHLLDVTAGDLDWNSVYMCYIQLSLLGIKAKVMQGDSLSGKEPDSDHIYLTPANWWTI